MFMTSKSSSYWGQKRGKGIEPQKAGCSLLRWMVASTSGWGVSHPCFFPEGRLQRHTTGSWAPCQAHWHRLGIPGGKGMSRGLWAVASIVCGSDPEALLTRRKQALGHLRSEGATKNMSQLPAGLWTPQPHPYWRQGWGRHLGRDNSWSCRC